MKNGPKHKPSSCLRVGKKAPPEWGLSPRHAAVARPWMDRTTSGRDIVQCLSRGHRYAVGGSLSIRDAALLLHGCVNIIYRAKSVDEPRSMRAHLGPCGSRGWGLRFIGYRIYRRLGAPIQLRSRVYFFFFWMELEIFSWRFQALERVRERVWGMRVVTVCTGMYGRLGWTWDCKLIENLSEMFLPLLPGHWIYRFAWNSGHGGRVWYTNRKWHWILMFVREYFTWLSLCTFTWSVVSRFTCLLYCRTYGTISTITNFYYVALSRF